MEISNVLHRGAFLCAIHFNRFIVMSIYKNKKIFCKISILALLIQEKWYILLAS